MSGSIAKLQVHFLNLYAYVRGKLKNQSFFIGKYSYEGYVIENILANLKRWRGSFYRTSNGAEIDLVLEKGNKTIAIEIKASANPKVSRGFWSSIEEVKADFSYVIAPVNEEYPLKKNVSVIPMPLLIEKLM